MGVVVLVLLSLTAWPGAVHAQGDLVVEPAWHEFGALGVGTVASATLDVWNDGSAPVTLGSVGFMEDPGPFALGDSGCVTGLVLEPDSGCEARSDGEDACGSQLARSRSSWRPADDCGSGWGQRHGSCCVSRERPA